MQRLRYSRYFRTLVILLDITVMVFILSFFYIRRVADFNIADQEKNFISLLLLSVFWLLLSSKTRIYDIPRNLTFTAYLQRFFTHIFIFSAVFLLFSRLIENDFLKEDRFFIVLLLFFSLFFLKSIIFFFLKFIRSKGYNYRNVMFLAPDSSSKILKEIITERKDYGYRIFDYPPKEFRINELIEFWRANGIHSIFLPSENNLDEAHETLLFEAAEAHQVKIALIPNIIRNDFFSYQLNYIQSQPILSPVKFPLEYDTNAVLKRVFDIAFSLMFLAFIGVWLFPIIAILIKLDSSGPVFFVQKRYGFHEEVFGCIKFRTMFVNGESSTKTTGANDRRITKIGRILRKTSLDETPQFVNVLLGHMSVVGPRPHMILVDNLYKVKIRRYAVRSLVKPGITGLAQVNGLRGDRGNMAFEMERRIVADSYYVKNWTFVLDLVIMLKTVVLLIEGDKNAC